MHMQKIDIKKGIIAGNFDVIHPGYIAMFNEMLEHCDHITILLQVDPTIERPEKCKPILNTQERISILSSLNQIGDIIPYTLESELHLILKKFEEINADKNNKVKVIRFLGDDYINKSFTGEDLAIPIKYLNRDHGWSTTKYKRLIAESLLIKDN